AAAPGELDTQIAAIIADRDRDQAAAQVLAETVTYLGAGIGGLVNLFSPERIVLGGWLGQALSDGLLPEIRRAAGRQALPLPVSRGADGHDDLGHEDRAAGRAEA